jgi:hypothetical protein
LQCLSEPGKGTEFIIEIPIRWHQDAANQDIMLDMMGIIQIRFKKPLIRRVETAPTQSKSESRLTKK